MARCASIRWWASRSTTRPGQSAAPSRGADQIGCGGAEQDQPGGGSHRTGGHRRARAHPSVEQGEYDEGHRDRDRHREAGETARRPSRPCGRTSSWWPSPSACRTSTPRRSSSPAPASSPSAWPPGCGNRRPTTHHHWSTGCASLPVTVAISNCGRCSNVTTMALPAGCSRILHMGSRASTPSLGRSHAGGLCGARTSRGVHPWAGATQRHSRTRPTHPVLPAARPRFIGVARGGVPGGSQGATSGRD